MPEPPDRPEPVLVSACLLGRVCRYDGRHNRDAVLERELAARGELAVPCCPEEAGGLGTPRPAASLTGSAEAVLDGRARVVTVDGRDVTAEYLAGARAALAECERTGARRAYLKERSPSCGVVATHEREGVVEGPGVTAALLARHGIAVAGVEGRRDAQA